MKRKWQITGLICCLFLVCFSFPGNAAAEDDGTDITDVNEKAAWVVDHCTYAGMTEEETALALHDWLTDNAYYDITFSAPDCYDAAGVLVNGTGVCDSYSKAYVLLLNTAGIEAKRVTGMAVRADGSQESHSWNLVKMDGKWYQVDVTWDDPIDNSYPEARKSGLEHHLYFKATKRFMNEEHVPDNESAELINTLVTEDVNENLPEGVEQSERCELTDLHLITSDGKELTSSYVQGKNMILVYGRITCVNTRAFLSDISPYLEFLSRRGVRVLVALFDDPTEQEMKEFEKWYPGILCTKVTDDDYSMWYALNEFGYDGQSVIFPVIYLKNQQNKLTYFSTGYVEEPLKIVSGALNMTKKYFSAEIILPDHLTCIEAEAFRGGRFASVELGRSVTEIGDYAFADNPMLQLIIIPSSVNTISSSAFYGCSSSLTIIGQSGSVAETYAKDHGIAFENTEEN